MYMFMAQMKKQVDELVNVKCLHQSWQQQWCHCEKKNFSKNCMKLGVNEDEFTYHRTNVKKFAHV